MTPLGAKYLIDNIGKVQVTDLNMIEIALKDLKPAELYTLQIVLANLLRLNSNEIQRHW